MSVPLQFCVCRGRDLGAEASAGGISPRLEVWKLVKAEVGMRLKLPITKVGESSRG